MEVAFYGGQFIDINEKVVPIQERGHQFGDGIYEVVRVYNGIPFMLEEHLDRLEKSAEAILLSLPYDRQKITEIISEALDRSGILEAEIYFQITRGIAPRNHTFPENAESAFALAVKEASRTMDEEKRKAGISVSLMEDERWKNCYIKSLNLLPNVLAKQKAKEKGCAEAVLIRDGFITEGASSNIFIVKDGTLYTTPATHEILHGITRIAVFKLAQKRNIPLKEQKFTHEDLLNADEAFMTSTSLEISRIQFVDNHEMPANSPITKQLAEDFTNLYSQQSSNV